jgi:peptide/nickel transport system substrate-binding protein
MFNRRGVALCVALSLTVWACGGDDDDQATDEATTADPSGETSPAAAADTAPATAAATTAGESATTAASESSAPGDDAPTGNPDAVMRMQIGTNGGSNYDPHVAFNQFASVFLYPAYDRLLELTPEGELVPMLAESWEFSEGDTVLRLTLRDDVVFHDGTPFDAEAVKANIERGQTLETSAVKADLAPISEVVVVEPYVVDLRLAGPGAALPALLADRAGMMISPAAFANPDLDLRPVGAGPWQVVDHQPGTVITFERFPEYWDPDAQLLAGVELTMQLDPEARLRAFIDGQIDSTALNPDQIETAESAGVTVDSEPTASAFMLYLNKTKPGLDNPHVREAISLAIDREAIAEALHFGKCTPSAQVFPAGYWATSPDLEPDPYDPETARALLEEAGYGDGLALNAVVVNVPFYTSQLEAIQAMLAEVGIDLTVTSLEPTELLSRFASGGADMYFSQWPGATDPAKTIASIFSEQSALNPGGYTNPEMVQLATEGLATIEQEARAPIYQQFNQVAAEDHFHIVICNGEAIFVNSPSVQNLRPTLGGSVDLRGVSIDE